MARELMRCEADITVGGSEGTGTIGLFDQIQDFVFSQGFKVAVVPETVSTGARMATGSEFVFVSDQPVVRRYDTDTFGGVAQPISEIFVFSE